MSKRSGQIIKDPIKKFKLEEVKDLTDIRSVCYAKIFMYLNVFDRIAIEEVCQSWKFICKNSAWHDVKKFECRHSLGRSIDNRKLEQTDVIKLLPYCGEYLRHLKLSKICDSSILLNVGVYCTNLTHLEIEVPFNFNSINANYYIHTFVKLINLRCIKIQDVRGMNKISYPAFPLQVINYLPEGVDDIFVSSLYYKQHEKPDYNIFFPTLEKFKRLRRLHLKHWILKKETLKIIGTKKTLVHLTLLDCQIENDDLPLLITELENLEYLEISGNWNIENSLNGISKKCTNLKQLKLRKYPMSYSSVFEEILQLYNLECLVICDVENVDDNYIIQITKNLKKLKTLEFGCCDNFTNDTLQQLGQLKELEHLLLSSAHNDESINSITNNCNKLKSLRLFHCTGTSSALCELGKLKYLETLHLYDIENVNDDVIICIANQCKNLKTLKINFSLKLTEIGLKEIEKLENLECLELKHIKNITDVVFNKKYKLKTFKCFDSTKFTDQGLKKLLKNCQSLETLIINSAVFTNQVLLCAIEETKKRTNNILLTIIDMGKCHIKVGSNINSTPLLEIIHKFV